MYELSGQGKYLGTLSNNRYDPNSVSNPYGQYGSKYSPDSSNNLYTTCPPAIVSPGGNLNYPNYHLKDW